MTPAAQVQVAIGILSSFAKSKKPVADMLRDWGRKNRFAGSKDRAALSGVVFETLRRYKSSAYILESDRPRSRVLGALWQYYKGDIEKCAAIFDGSQYGPDRLNEGEAHKLNNTNLSSAPLDIKADFPSWLNDDLRLTFDEDIEKHMKSFCERAPLDIRVNETVMQREKLMTAWGDLSPDLMPHSYMGVRFVEDDIFMRLPNLAARQEYTGGLFDIQDEASQICSILTFNTLRNGGHLLDYCAGAGGKSLAVAGLRPDIQIVATDKDEARLKPLSLRAERAGAQNIKISTLPEITGMFETVLVDAPCSGSGTWRRKPESKWRLSQENLSTRLKEQKEALTKASSFVKKDGYLIYATCSILECENRSQAKWFLKHHDRFESVDWKDIWSYSDEKAAMPPNVFGQHSPYLQLSPASSATDGFFVSIFKRN